MGAVLDGITCLDTDGHVGGGLLAVASCCKVTLSVLGSFNVTSLKASRLSGREKGGSARVRSPVAMVMYVKKDSIRKMGKALRSMQLVRWFRCRQCC